MRHGARKPAPSFAASRTRTPPCLGWSQPLSRSSGIPLERYRRSGDRRRVDGRDPRTGGGALERRHSATLCFVTIGESRPAQIYVNRLRRLGAPAGIEVSTRALADDVQLDELDRVVSGLNADDAVDGIIVQMPLPPDLTYEDIAQIIDPRKDVDGITVHSGGLLYLGLPGHPPSTASAMLHILDAIGVNPTGKDAVVVGRSNVVGHPVAELLLERDATVTVTHRQTRIWRTTRAVPTF